MGATRKVTYSITYHHKTSTVLKGVTRGRWIDCQTDRKPIDKVTYFMDGPMLYAFYFDLGANAHNSRATTSDSTTVWVK